MQYTVTFDAADYYALHNLIRMAEKLREDENAAHRRQQKHLTELGAPAGVTDANEAFEKHRRNEAYSVIDFGKALAERMLNEQVTVDTSAQDEAERQAEMDAEDAVTGFHH